MDYPKYDRNSPNTPLSDAELNQLDELLQGLAEAGVDGAMTLDGMDGYLTALLVGPSTLLDSAPTADWLPLIWGGDGPNGAPFPSNQKRKRSTVLVLRHLQSIACMLRDDPEHWEPVFSVAEVGERDFADAGDWCTGFLQATDLDPAAWEPLFDDPQVGQALVPIALLGGDASEEDSAAARLDDPEVRDDLSRAAAEAVMALLALREPG